MRQFSRLAPTQFQQTGESVLLDEATELRREALGCCIPGDPARRQYLWALADISQRLLPCPDLNVALDYLCQVFSASSYADTNQALIDPVTTLLRIDPSALSIEQRGDLFTLHASAVDLVSLAAGLAISTNTQLQHMRRGRTLGHASFKLATRLNKLSIGLQVLERVRRVLWTQLLHLRDPQLEHIPDEYAIKLQSLLQAGTRPQPVSHVAGASVTTDRSLEFAQRSQRQNMPRKIRSLPGSSEFMRGPDERTLQQVGTLSPVVVFIAETDGCYALIVSSGSRLEHVSLPDYSLMMLEDLTFAGLASQKRGSDPNVDRGMSISRGRTPAHARLA